MVLKLVKTLALPNHPSGGFDHGDVVEVNGLSVVAHTGNGTVEVYNGRKGVHIKTIPDMPGASGVVCGQDEKLVIAASRGTGRILVLDGDTGETIREMQVGLKPNGLAWDSRRHRFLAADVGDNHIRVADPKDGSIVGDIPLPGRPRWAKYSDNLDRYVVNINDPSIIAIVDPETNIVEVEIPVPVDGPHGVDVDEETGIAYIACDGGGLVSVDIKKREVLGEVMIHPNPDVAWLNIEKKLLYVANSRPGSVQVVDVNEMKVVEEITTEEGAHTFSFDQKAQTLHAYLPKSCMVVFYKEN